VVRHVQFAGARRPSRRVLTPVRATGRHCPATGGRMSGDTPPTVRRRHPPNRADGGRALIRRPTLRLCSAAKVADVFRRPKCFFESSPAFQRVSTPGTRPASRAFRPEGTERNRRATSHSVTLGRRQKLIRTCGTPMLPTILTPTPCDGDAGIVLTVSSRTGILGVRHAPGWSAGARLGGGRHFLSVVGRFGRRFEHRVACRTSGELGAAVRVWH
jgi:hypothetical protein